MKKIILLFAASVFVVALRAQSHPNNIDMGLFNNGTNGSNIGSGGNIEVALRIKSGGLSYTPTPAAEDLVVYLKAPKTDFAETDVVNITQVNSAFLGTTSTTALLSQGVIDIGDPAYLYMPIVLNTTSINLSSLNSVTNAWSFLFTISFTPAKTAAQFNGIVILDQLNNTDISTILMTPVFSTLSLLTDNQLTAGGLSTLPVSLVNFSGYKSGAKNVLKWTTASEQNSRGFELQRSSDGASYTTIGFVNSQAVGGNSNAEISYSFDDNSPLAHKSYYRLKQIDYDNNSKLSNVVVISGDKPRILSISSLFPNPASDLVNVIIDAPQREDVVLVVTDIFGRTIKQQLVNVEIGSNTVPVAVDQLAPGSYLVKVVSRNTEGETTISKFIKQ